MNANEDHIRLHAMGIAPCDIPAPEPQSAVLEGEAVSGYTLDGEPAVVMSEAAYHSIIQANQNLYGALTISRAANAELQKDRKRLVLEHGGTDRWFWLFGIAAFVCGVLVGKL